MVLFKLPSRYEYVGPRYEGGQGYVSIYKDTNLDRKVAVKYMKSVADAEVLRKELSALRDLSSRHVVQVYDLLFSKNSSAAALIQEYIPGDDLREYVKTSCSIEAHLKTLWQLSCGLEDIHAQSKVHRDIKPSNVKFDGERILKILDFGLVSQLPSDDETVNARGTRHYLSPELCAPPPVKVTSAMDVYAFGVTAWYLLNAGTLPKALRQDPPQSDSRVPSFSTASFAVPSLVVTMLDRTLSLDPRRRPRISDVRQVLEDYLLTGRHVLTLSEGNNKRVLGSSGATATLRVGAASLAIRYNGLSFLIESVEGEVYINNTPAQAVTCIPGSCVLTFGSSGGPVGRTFVSASISKPEVVL